MKTLVYFSAQTFLVESPNVSPAHAPHSPDILELTGIGWLALLCQVQSNKAMALTDITMAVTTLTKKF